MSREILSKEEIVRLLTGMLQDRGHRLVDSHEALRADRDRWRVTAESDAADLAMAYALGELAAADRDRLASLVDVTRKHREWAERSKDAAEARVAHLEAVAGNVVLVDDEADLLVPDWQQVVELLREAIEGLRVALAPASDQHPIPQQTTASPMGDLGTSGYVKVIPRAPGGES